ncbi:DUF2510 domain-containing protein [Streptomyces sp. NPDC046939]|uniref:DUF2510 domain-containing protein n=1 Tax=Streptomyces sp. NPDC046939 TaxID=3155376 RepID=UPI0033C42192
MTSQTPAGWYPDPGQPPEGPRTERWWDGGRWTDQTRPAAAPPPYPQTAPGAPTAPNAYPAYGGQPGYPGYPGYPAQVPSTPRNGARVAIAAGVAVVVLAGVVGGVYALTSGDDGKNGTVGAASEGPRGPKGPEGGPGGGNGGDEPSPEASGSSQPPLDEGYATDVLNGVALPVLDHWTGSDGAGAAGVQTGPYKCPDDVKQTCVKGGASVASAKSLKLDGTTAEAVAKEDILKNSTASYGGEVYGGVVQHDEVLSEKVTVAGQQGYRVRWNVDTKSNIDAWVESVAFPSPSDPRTLLVVRIGVDMPRTKKEEAAGPDNTAIDKIVKGIKKAEVTGADLGGGNGKDV